MPERRSRGGRWLLAALAIGAAAAFAYLNSGERVSIHLGFFVLFRVPLAALTFGAFLAGMVTMFLLGLRHDLRVRRRLREYQVREEGRPWRLEPPPDLPP